MDSRLTNKLPETFAELCDMVRDDILLADAIFLPFSYPLSAHQQATMREYAEKKFVFQQAVRGAAKSYITARFMLVYGLTHKLKGIMTAPTYRQALLVFNYIVDLIKENSTPANPIPIRSLLDGKIVGGGSIEARMKFKNGTVLKALPMGDGGRIRGERADILHCDEFFKMERQMFEKHILPFLLKPIIKASAAHPNRPPQTESKLFMTTSAEYEDCYAYHFLVNTMLKKMVQEDALVEKDPSYRRKYCVLDWKFDDLMALGYELEPDIIELQTGNASREEKDRALNNKWVGISGQFFPANLADRLATPSVVVEHEAAADCEYSLTVDVATAKDGDNFVIDVFKFLPNKKMALVNTYMNVGLSNDDMAYMVHHYNKLFHPEWIVIDKGGGGLFLQQNLSKRKLILQSPALIGLYGDEHDIKEPLVLWDEEEIFGVKKLILNKPNDPMIQGAFAGIRARGGEYITTEDVFSHFLYDTLKKHIMSPEPTIVIPFSAHLQYDGEGDNSKGERYLGSEQNIIDNIRESIHQLRHLRLKTTETPEGQVEIVLSKMGKVPSYLWRQTEKDGAVCFCYGLIPYLLHFKEERGTDRGKTNMIIQPSYMEEHMYSDLYGGNSGFLDTLFTR